MHAVLWEINTSLHIATQSVIPGSCYMFSDILKIVELVTIPWNIETTKKLDCVNHLKDIVSNYSNWLEFIK